MLKKKKKKAVAHFVWHPQMRWMSLKGFKFCFYILKHLLPLYLYVKGCSGCFLPVEKLLFHSKMLSDHKQKTQIKTAFLGLCYCSVPVTICVIAFWISPRHLEFINVYNLYTHKSIWGFCASRNPSCSLLPGMRSICRVCADWGLLQQSV